jgi:Txe/YoeB family toxin of toxin-antitoxin system
MTWNLLFSKQAGKDAKTLEKTEYYSKVKELLKILKQNPFQTPPSYEKLNPPRDRKYSRRINSQHRLVYEIDESKKQVKILKMWTHYE